MNKFFNIFGVVSLGIMMLFFIGCSRSEKRSAETPHSILVPVIEKSYCGRFKIVSGFNDFDWRTGIVVDTKTGIKYFATFDTDKHFYIGGPVIENRQISE